MAIDYSPIELLVLDVDGVMTDGRIMLDPDGRETKVFNVRDGWAMRHWRGAGGKVAIITGRGSRAVEIRAAELGVDVVRLNVKQKRPVFDEVLAELGVSADRVAVMGDDVTDLPVMRRCAVAIAPADAVDEVRQAAHLVTEAAGGAGCVREAIETMLKATGKWDDLLARYTSD